MKYRHIDGQASFCVENQEVAITTTVQSGCTMPYFKLDGREICPYWTAPWWKDGAYLDGNNILSVLRGNFICVARKEDNNNPEHGWCCASPWEAVEAVSQADEARLELRFQEPYGGTIRKTLRAVAGQKAVYETNLLSGFAGNYSISNHPCVRLASKAENGYVAFSEPDSLCTPRFFLETPEGGGYMLLARDEAIADYHSVRSIYGDTLDLAYHPAKPGTFELLGAFHRQQFVYAAYLNREEGYLYYQIKSTRDFPYIMLWMFSGGRHYAPWNGTQSPTLGIGDCADYPAFLKNPGQYNTFVTLRPEQSYRFRQIYGVAALPEGMTKIESVQFEADGATFLGNDGKRVFAPFDWSFLKDG